MTSVLLSLFVTILVAGLFGLLVWETIRLAINKIPITGLVRYTEAHVVFRWVATAYFVSGGVIGWLVDHFGHF